jgi:hypothetical protein
MPVGALTGARIDAICDLRVRDCREDQFTFKRAKREPKGRTIPIHPRLRSIIKRRTHGKKPDDFLFEELPAATKTRPRSAAASQAFIDVATADRIGDLAKPSPNHRRQSAKNLDPHLVCHGLCQKLSAQRFWRRVAKQLFFSSAPAARKDQGRAIARSRSPELHRPQTCVSWDQAERRADFFADFDAFAEPTR